jgi:glycerol-3-phosphate dehydrogenase
MLTKELWKGCQTKMSKSKNSIDKGYLGGRIGGAIWLYATRRGDRIFLVEGGDFSEKFF